MSEQYLMLKWGTLKGWNLTGNEAAIAAAQRYNGAGLTSMSAMAQHDNAEQKQAICDMIDAIDGPITNDWSGESMTKDEAKAYVMGYDR
ncbi:hypothetical protein [Sphingomonas beigongshangi]|uniref:hypothetical protein n=1 Tax=Sphingomonas beigongshangi TaxID=2782540 RepID=UPI00193B9116|nr:hypothetical protein [Sphingomonas beigongshangi]